jgi:serine/threonine protein kinase
VSPARHHHALPEGYQLHWYEIDSILGQGGFGITYLARDTNLDQLVAIKEFLPSDLAVRTQDSAVHPLSGGHSDTYGWGLNRFLTEARTLAKFRHANIVRVMSVFEANNTAYMVMEYERGESFENMLKFKQVSGEATLKNILMALLDGLELVHDAGFIHRDIKPSNIYLREDGVPVLLDFGSARLALGVETRTLTSLVSPGYAPFEQYNATRESDKQGPWTDIYALGATIYRSVTGQGPIDAAARANLLLDEQRDPFQPCTHMGLEQYTPGFLQAIDRALAFPPADRPQSVAAWRQLLTTGAVDSGAETVAVDASANPVEQVDFVLDADTATIAAPATESSTRTLPISEVETAVEPVPEAKSSGRAWFIATSIVAIAGIAVAAWLSRAPAPRDDNERTEATAPAVPPEVLAEQAAEGPPLETSAQPPVDTSAQPAQAPDSTHAVPPASTAGGQNDARAPSAKVASQAAPQENPPTIVAAAAPAPAPAAPSAAKLTPAAPPRAPTTPSPPAKRSPGPALVPKMAPEKKPAKPRTREEKVAALLVSGERHLRADRLTQPRRSNALSDYLTALAIDTDNAAARRGVEQIVKLYVGKIQQATQARQFDKANEYAGRARFVLDAMKLREWPSATYDALFADYREANRQLAAAR